MCGKQFYTEMYFGWTHEGFTLEKDHIIVMYVNTFLIRSFKLAEHIKAHTGKISYIYWGNICGFKLEKNIIIVTSVWNVPQEQVDWLRKYCDKSYWEKPYYCGHSITFCTIIYTGRTHEGLHWGKLYQNHSYVSKSHVNPHMFY